MSREMLLAGALCLISPGLAMARAGGSVPAVKVTQPSPKPADARKVVETQAARNLRLVIRGGTATWAFRFVCVGTRCSFRNTHVPRGLRLPEHVDLAVSMSGITVGNAADARPQRTASQATAAPLR